jgi:hypothetical protein
MQVRASMRPLTAEQRCVPGRRLADATRDPSLPSLRAVWLCAESLQCPADLSKAKQTHLSSQLQTEGVHG